MRTNFIKSWKSAVVIFVALVSLLSTAITAVGPGLTAAAPAVPDIAWSPCTFPGGASIDCSKVNVPLNYKKWDGEKISISISRVKATNPEKRRGVLLVNPGGPGGPGLDWPFYLAQLLPPEVLEQYDLIGFDPRFVSTSTPISCGLNAKDAYDAVVPPTQPGGFKATVQFVKRVAESCGKNAGTFLPHATTANTARDMDVIRRALKEQKISYLGYSYGTHLGAVYASAFPDKTDRIILDSSTNPEWAWREQFRAWGLAGEVRFPDFSRFAADNHASYNLGATQGEVRDLYFALMERLREHPIPLGEDLTLDDQFFRELTFGALYYDGAFPELAMIWQFVNETPTDARLKPLVKGLMPFEPKAKEIPIDNSSASALAILCADQEWPTSLRQYRNDHRDDSAQYPMFGGLGSNIWPCAFWPAHSQGKPIRIGSGGPRNIMILQGLRDPATPYWGAYGMRAALGQRASLVTVDQGGHGVYGLSVNNCATTTATRFLTEGILPSEPHCPVEGDIKTKQDSAKHPVLRDAQRRLR